jgi:poly(hydroxyalkanoate) depolymerase family esterase
MRRLSDTLARLNRLPRGLPQIAPTSTRLQPFNSSRANPGQLSAWIYAPESAAPGAPLVVVLHGCTQNAAGYDESSGWSRLADRHGFVLVYPEQRRSNNPHLCFNWFSAADAARGKGEARSIREMVAEVQARLLTDPGRVFVTGLSAGGAMAAAMLATYPEVFAGGAVIAGLPFGVAQSVPEAFDRMRGCEAANLAGLSDLVLAASNHSGKWPTLSVWHGSADQTVDQSNAAALVNQWRALHGAPKTPSKVDLVHGYPHRVWRDSGDRDVIEEYSITGLAHGTPLDTRGSRHGEKAAPFMIEAGISSTRLIGQFWGILPHQVHDLASIAPAGTNDSAERRPQAAEAAAWSRPQTGIGKTIEDALRSAGLIR